MSASHMDTRGPWGPVLTVVLGLAIFVVFYLVQLWTLVTMHDRMLAERPIAEVLRFDGLTLSVAILAGAVICSALVFATIHFRRGPSIRDYLRLYPVPFRLLLFWLGLQVVLMVGWDVFTWAIGREVIPEFMREAYFDADTRPLLFVAVVIGAPFFEEVFFRGFLFEGLSRSRLGLWGTIVLTAAVWALVHLQYDLYEMFSVFLLGLIFGYARHRTGSLVVPLGMHALVNGIAFVEVAVASA